MHASQPDTSAAHCFAASSSESGNARACPGQRTLKILMAGPAVKMLSLLWPGQARAFPLSEIEAAKRWAAEDVG